jgi:hypothetical protein
MASPAGSGRLGGPAMRPSALGRSTGSLPPAGKCPASALKSCLGLAVGYSVQCRTTTFLMLCIGLSGKELACVACSMSLQTVMLQPVKKPAFFIYNIIVCYCDDYYRYYQVHDAFKGMSLP